MKIILPGGTGRVGQLLVRELTRDGHECVVLTRGGPVPPGARAVTWDAHTVGPWAAELEGANAVINLAGKSVDCRYSERNLAEMMRSRVDSTHAVGAAIAAAKNPPRAWLQAATATIYGHRYDAPNDEATGLIGDPPGVPALWPRSVEIGQAWEAAQAAIATPRTRQVALRMAMVMSPGKGGVFHILSRHCRLGFGRFGDGRQYVSWMHEHDFAEAVKFLLVREDLAGPVNLCAPHPLPNRDFIAALRRVVGGWPAFPVPCWMLEIGTFFLRTETELILKSRRVVPGRLLAAGFKFQYPTWPEAAAELVARDNR
jgi:uncharacterized protein (TIGR01777 family)